MTLKIKHLLEGKVKININKFMTSVCTCAMVMILGACGSTDKENKVYTDLNKYYNISDIGQYEGAAVVINGEVWDYIIRTL